MYPSGSIDAALEVVAVDVVEGRARDAAVRGVGRPGGEGVGGAVAAFFICGIETMPWSVSLLFFLFVLW
jgi:hypothetical protein